jgi:hypothetical protein
MKTLFLQGLKVNYEVSKDNKLVISFYSPYDMTDSEKRQTLAKIGNYLISEGFVKLPVDEQTAM